MRADYKNLMPMGMWLLFSGSFRKQLEEVLGYSREEKDMNHIPIDENPYRKPVRKWLADLPDLGGRKNGHAGAIYGGFLVSRRTENNYIAEGENG